MKKKLWILALFALASCGEKDAPPAKTDPPRKTPPVDVATPAPDTSKNPDADKPAPKKEMHVDERGVSRDPKVYNEYVGIMEGIGKAHKALKKDVEAKKDEAALKAHLKVILESVRKARKLRYLKTDEQNDDFDVYFDIFDMKINQFLEDDWAEDKAESHFERFATTCNTCHDVWRD